MDFHWLPYCIASLLRGSHLRLFIVTSGIHLPFLNSELYELYQIVKMYSIQVTGSSGKHFISLGLIHCMISLYD